LAQRVGRCIALLFLTAALERGKRSAARPGRTLPPGKTRYPFYRRLGGRNIIREDQIKEQEMERECSMHGIGEKYAQNMNCRM